MMNARGVRNKHLRELTLLRVRLQTPNFTFIISSL